jgi:FAD/FMN-containing dehydrogenase
MAQPLNDGWYLKHPKTHDIFPMTGYDDFVCSAMSYPKDTGEVQAIVRWANKHKIPVYPISIGRNLGYGGAARKIPPHFEN